ncbi:unnamed protein product [Coffea canephora]|uniref:Phytocyanin domain-containing protein n=1 Tax=Coffea canephora TaxID=49390 RepID=A0A068UGL8_COFCA|nr:unnamed protein product [Coffea canephora]
MAITMSFGKGLLILLLTLVATLAISQAETVVVGGSEGWRYGCNYTDWALKHGPFFLNDTLVFRYPPPNDTVKPHSVYLLPNLYSFLTCDFKAATLVAPPNQGGGDGFSYTLSRVRPNYFASGEGNGDDCTKGLMKFAAIPLYRPPFP